MILMLLGVQLVIGGWLLLIATPHYSAFLKEQKIYLKLSFAAPLSLWLMDRLRLADHLSEPLSRVHQVMAGLHGSKTAVIRTKCFAANVITIEIIVLFGSTVLSLVSEGGAEMLLYGCCLNALLPFIFYKELAVRLQKKKRQMLLELPEVVNLIVLLVNAGETLQKALMRCMERKSDIEASPLLTELAKAAYEIQMNASFTKSMEDFNKRCGVQEVSLFTTTLLLNYKRGGDELVMSLKELSSSLWEKRKSLAKTLGEEASSKMVFPMVVIFMVVMVVVAAPAIMTMG
ncbi:type II secretion system F family protein [Paenibacillus radicis (ex Xue et al. 2023)]|uniref:Type II secretion system F family protein n=1 Tax=Paenibacillus radicis (ex Xue et al. 2023) TaxID=2972489 RepID=A0ABT1YFA0_9BACL|nr:type II secretion system F family protein [Paenibacillus radicis (ex Xue et al. 2023)]MCR8631864.1 type II secretion system F family protein [Paenibacillus radicis (ex Xue et al. 2023)]